MPRPVSVPTAGASWAPAAVTRLSMAHASDAGWTDLEVWPGTNDDGDPCTITTLTTQTNFRITIPAGSLALPTGVTQPTLMVWDATLSRFESLKVLSVVLFGGSVYTVTLNAAPTATLAVGSWISPDAAQREELSRLLPELGAAVPSQREQLVAVVEALFAFVSNQSAAPPSVVSLEGLQS